MNTPLPLDAAARNLLHYINVMPDADTLLTPEILLAETQLRAALPHPDTLAARVAELEAANADLRNDNEHFRKQAWERVLEANALRDALVKARDLLCEDSDSLPGFSFTTRAHECITAALAAHPAASLAAYRKSVLEEAATECVVAVHAPDDMQHDPLRLETFDDAVGACAAAIRALAAQAQEVTK